MAGPPARSRVGRVIFLLVCGSPLLVVVGAIVALGVLEFLGAHCTDANTQMWLDGAECNRAGELQYVAWLVAIAAFMLSLPVALVTGAAGLARWARARRRQAAGG